MIRLEPGHEDCCYTAAGSNKIALSFLAGFGSSTKLPLRESYVNLVM